MILSFNDNAESFKNTGKKSYNLAKSIELGFNVPKYVCITPTDCNIDTNTISKSSLNTLLQVLKQNFSSNTLYVVRTSTNLDGIDGISLSEQFETFFNIKINDLEKYINKSLSAKKSKRILSYIKRHGLVDTLEINIMIQEMCPQEYSGVLYTVNPSGILSEKVITIGGGTCNDILENKQSSNTYYFNNDGNSYLLQNSNAYSLTQDIMNRLFSMADVLKESFSSNIKLDFYVDSNTIYVLQVDTIASSTENVITLHETETFLDSIIDTNLPLTTSFIKECYESVFSNLILHLTNSPEIVKANEDIIKHTLTTYNGRIYYNINNLYNLFSLIPFADKITPVLEKEFKVETQKELLKKNDSNNFSFILTLFNLLTSTNKKIKDMNDSFTEVEKIFNDCYCEELSDIQLKSLYKIIFSKTISKWDTDIINSIYCYFYSYVLNKFFKKNIDIYSLEIHNKMELDSGLAGTIQQRILTSLSSQETTRENKEKLYKYIQKIFVHMGMNLVNLGYIDDENDVYYITVDELFNEGMHSYKDLVSQRKQLYNFYKKLPKYKMVTFNGKILSKNAIKNGEIFIL